MIWLDAGLWGCRHLEKKKREMLRWVQTHWLTKLFSIRKCSASHFVCVIFVSFRFSCIFSSGDLITSFINGVQKYQNKKRKNTAKAPKSRISLQNTCRLADQRPELTCWGQEFLLGLGRNLFSIWRTIRVGFHSKSTTIEITYMVTPIANFVEWLY